VSTGIALTAVARSIQNRYPERAMASAARDSGICLESGPGRSAEMKQDWNKDVHAYQEAIAVAALAVVLSWAVRRPRGLPEAVAAVPAAALVIGAGAVSWDAALSEVRRLAPVVGFLACVLVLAKLCDDDGLFRACGAWLARGSGDRPGRRLLARVFVVASVTTAVTSPSAPNCGAKAKPSSISILSAKFASRVDAGLSVAPRAASS